MPKRANGEGTIRKRTDKPSATKFEGRMRFEDPRTGEQKRISVYGPTMAEVRRRLREAQDRIEEGAPVRDSSRTVGDWCTYWCDTSLAASGRALSTKDNYRSILTSHVVDQHLGSIRLDKLVPSDVDVWSVEMKVRGLADSTTAKVFRTLRIALAGAVRDKLIAKNPLDVVTLGTDVEVEEVTALDADQLQALFAQLRDGRYEPIAQFIFATGMRKGEALALKWDQHYDRSRAKIKIRGTLARRLGALIVSAPKTAKSRRDLDVSEEVADLLKTQRISQKKDKLRAGGEWVETGFIFTTETGQPMDPRNVLRAISTAGKKAKLVGVNVHTLRHTAATMMLEMGLYDRAVSDILGHADTRFTSRVYVHPSNETKRKAMAGLGAMIG